MTIETLMPYPAYKESDVWRLGQVPAHWRVLRLRNAVDMRVSTVDKHSRDGEVPVRLCNYVDVYKSDRITDRIPFMRASATVEEVTRFRLQKSDVLITKDSEEWSDIGVPALVAYSDRDVLCGYHLALLRPRPKVMNGSFLLRVHQTRFVSYQYHIEANGVTRYGLSHNAIKSVLMPCPPLEEQAAIARFLDHEDRKIRRYINVKKRLVSVLNEQKQPIIYQAVSRGLNPNVRLKVSGLEWLGDIAEHWEVRRNGRLFAQRNQTGFADLPILEVSLRTGVRVRDFEKANRKQIMADRGKYKRAVQGDIAYNMMRMWQGAVGVAPVDGLVSPAYIVARPLSGTEPRYFSQLFRTYVYMREVDKFSRGIVKDRNRLYWEDFKQMPSPCPPRHEQKEIADAIEQSTRALTAAIDRAEREIDLILAYRTRLIEDVVLGRLDVRGVAARLDDHADDEQNETFEKEFESTEALEEVMEEDMLEDA